MSKMIYCKNLRKLIALIIIFTFVFQADLILYSQGKDEIIKGFEGIKNVYNDSGRIDESIKRLERLIGTIVEKNLEEEKKDILGQCYLLRGAFNEKKGELIPAEENYRKAKEYSAESIENIDLDSLPIYRRVIKGDIDTPFQKAVDEYNNGQYDNSKSSLEKVIGFITNDNLDKKEILGKCYLLLGAINEKKEETTLAEENYGKAKEYGAESIENIVFDRLPIYRRVVKGEVDIAAQFQNVVGEYNNGQYDNSRYRLERLISIINEMKLEIEEKEILGKCYLLLGAISEKKGEKLLAEENYRKSKIYEIKSIDGVDLTRLPIYKKVVLRIKKKFPVLLVIGGVALVVTAILLLRKKKAPSPKPAFVTSTDSITVPEGGTADFNVKLLTQPSSTVSVAVTRVNGDTDIYVQTGSNLTFTTSNWNQNQTVLLAANEDVDTINSSATIRISASGIQNKDLTATEQDNDTITFITNTSSVTVNEGTTATFQVKLSHSPAANIQATVTRVSGDTDISVESGESLTFTASNWSTYQTVTLKAADDTDAINGQARIRISAAGISKDVIATEFDTDSIHFVTNTDFVTIPEEGTAVLKVKLSKLPASDITANISWISGDSDISVKPENSVLTFTTTNGNTYQNVTLRAKDDSDSINDQATIRISDANIFGVPNRDITAIEIDNDTLNFVTDTDEVTVLEGGTGTFNVKLSAQPSSDVTATVSFLSGDTDISVSPESSSITFTTTNWNTEQPVTLQAADDTDTLDGQTNIRISAPGITDKNILAKEADND